MIHHLSISASDPKHVSGVLAEMMGGTAVPFPPNPGSYFALQLDGHGSGVEGNRAPPIHSAPIGCAIAFASKFGSTRCGSASGRDLAPTLPPADRPVIQQLVYQSLLEPL
jgi:hypothetical protein